MTPAGNGRLQIKEPSPGRFELSYCTGQYWPTEYRPAVCRVLAGALWDYWRSNMPESCGTETKVSGYGGFERTYSTDVYQYGSRKLSAGDWLRAKARDELGWSITKRWFN